jgi:acetyl/propionyl-CoA carboxylase alpha subunit
VQLKLAVDGVDAAVAVQALGGACYRIACGATTVDMELLEWQAGHSRVATPDGRIDIEWAHESGRLFVASNGVQTVVEDRTLTAVLTGGAAAAGMIRAPMAGRIAAVFAAAGQQVEKGAPLLVLEAMKMEHPSAAPMAAVVKQVFVAHGDQVAAGALLVELAAQ